MSATEVWIITVLAVIIAGAIGFSLGRRKAPGGQEEIKTLMQEYELKLTQQQAEFENYQQQVHEHNDQTATLFKDMAGSYKDLFDHLSTGYEKLGNYSDKRVLPDRAGALLDGPDVEHAKETNFIHPNYKGDEDALNH
jgi:hypothetical protein